MLDGSHEFALKLTLRCTQAWPSARRLIELLIFHQQFGVRGWVSTPSAARQPVNESIKKCNLFLQELIATEKLMDNESSTPQRTEGNDWESPKRNMGDVSSIPSIPYPFPC